jgi:hypothetical protein
VGASREQLTQQIQQRLAENDTRTPAFQLLGKVMFVRTLASFSISLPGLDRRAKAHEPLLKFTLPEGQTVVMRETNPRVYAALLTATVGEAFGAAGGAIAKRSDGFKHPS